MSNPAGTLVWALPWSQSTEVWLGFLNALRPVKNMIRKPSPLKLSEIIEHF